MVRYGSLADMVQCPRHVCFTPESRRSLSARSGHSCIGFGTVRLGFHWTAELLETQSDDRIES